MKPVVFPEIGKIVQTQMKTHTQDFFVGMLPDITPQLVLFNLPVLEFKLIFVKQVFVFGNVFRRIT